ncbi:MAG: hypothetical protein KDN05_12550 [Verrucomicrobiae bacterium]|nr:hypothetical protein [Verrucomicrobiae bacterium]MCP5532088.1 hypothetical protein [Akkermansiaceae bacterium]
MKEEKTFSTRSLVAFAAFAVGLGMYVHRKAQSGREVRIGAALATSLEIACNNFMTEYGVLPCVGDMDTTLRTDRDIRFLREITGLGGAGSRLFNSRSVQFLSTKKKPDVTFGFRGNPSESVIYGYFDPWGGPYFVILDLDYDGEVTVPVGGGITLHRRVAVWSNGPDGKPGTGDDVRTW